MPRWALAAILTAQVAFGCKCVAIPDPSVAFAKSEVVFAGTLISTSPDILTMDPEKILSRLREKYGLTDEELEALDDEDNPRALALSKEVMSELLPPEFRERIASAKDLEEVQSLLYEHLEDGVRFRIRVEELWKGSAQGTIEIWQELSSCAKAIDRDEPVLVYAHRDEKGRLTTHACDRGGPISSMGEDLAYLYRVRHSPETAVRLFGYVVSDTEDLKTADLYARVQHPIPYLAIELESADGKRATRTDSSGWFAIDGLKQGNYTLTVRSDPIDGSKGHLLKGPITVSIPPTGYVTQHLHIPKDLLDKK